MRILHTSDWHLGRSFHREGMLDAQSQFVDHVIEVARNLSVDLVVVSGDIYDRALPPVDAVELASDALRRLLGAGVRVVITSGNHDSASRLGFASDLIDAAGIHLRTAPAGVGSPVVVPDAHGDVAVYGLPYLEPDLLLSSWALAGRSHQHALDEAMRRVRADLGTRPQGTRSLVMAHAFVAGATSSDSERDIRVGGVSAVGRDTFDGVDYVALGHLHGRQTLSQRVRYSGSPLAYSFSEAAQVKGSWLVELGPYGLGEVEFIEAPVPRPLRLVRGTLAELLEDAALTDAEPAWVQATITDAERPLHAMERLRQRFPHALVLRYEPDRPAAGATEATRVAHLGTSDTDIVAQFFRDVRDRPPDAAEAALIEAACEACRVTADVMS